MFSLFHRKSHPVAVTYNERVARFWDWFQEVAPRFYASIENKKCDELKTETIAKVDELVPGLAWVYGHGRDSKGHSLTLSGEGNGHRQLLTLHWCAQAPVVPGWTFHASRQAGPIKGHVIELGGLRFDPKEIWVTPVVDQEKETIDLTVWHPAWERIDEQKRWTIVFLFLDESLGEYGTQWWIGEILFGKDRLADSFPLEELADYVAKTSAGQGWKKYPPGECWSSFTIKEPNDRYPRGDLITLSTIAPQLFRDYMKAEGELDDPLRDTGADYVYVSIAREFFPKGGEVTKRAEVEDALDVALKAETSGRCLGGGFGVERSYVDLLIFDGDRSLAIVQKTLRTLRVPAGTMIEFFAREKRVQRVAL